ncbi:hypothetical protein [Lysobacter enzymogenes]|uniref:hypothetical protein n=1 Tax=Lysobacter enzymogenes TaxID=69 RepID=UPI001AFB72D8|nr:hypothetical protein [Lysobacter enzymogenes]QQP99419.1 hypothetical protein JHW41_14965 [Lysobacter enzymogenes]
MKNLRMFGDGNVRRLKRRLDPEATAGRRRAGDAAAAAFASSNARRRAREDSAGRPISRSVAADSFRCDRARILLARHDRRRRERAPGAVARLPRAAPAGSIGRRANP